MRKIILGAFALSSLLVTNAQVTNLNASSIIENEMVNHDSRSTYNSTYGWYYGSLGYCDSHGDDVVYAKNTTAGGRTYQKSVINTDVGPTITQVKKNATSQVSDGAHRTYSTSWSDYN